MELLNSTIKIVFDVITKKKIHTYNFLLKII
ncbi:hypothetical protein N035_014315 [Klebsiella pneumoniae EGD-HP19-C]|nr:hypothetical protein N035_014315 [Klebsiella pneumoniae EGD-HP19-C]